MAAMLELEGEGTVSDEEARKHLEAVGERIGALVAPLSPIAKLHTFSEVVATIANAAGIPREEFLATMGAYYDGAPDPWFWSKEASKLSLASWSLACPACGSTDLTKHEGRRVIRCNACATGGVADAFLVEENGDLPDGGDS